MRKQIITFYLFILCSGLWTGDVFATGTSFTIHKLQTEYMETPLGIDEEKPRFSWQMQSDGQGASQTAYRIIVKDEAGREVWNSGKVRSDESLSIEYAGVSLAPRTRYVWSVTVWNPKNKSYTTDSWFETGMMNKEQEWSGAKWIGGGGEDMVLFPHYLPVFKINYTIQLDKTTTQSGFIYGANDERLMDENRNEYNLQNRKDESYIMFLLDIAPLDTDGEALLHIYRTGYHPEDKKEKPFHSFPIPLSLICKENRYDKHTIIIRSDLGYSWVYLNEEKKENQIGEINLNPLGIGGDFLAFPVVGDIGYYVPGGGTATFSEVEIRNFRSPSNLLLSVLDTDTYTIRGGETGFMEFIHPEEKSSPMLRTVFTSSGQTIHKARLYVTARGIYDIYLNGERVGEDYFNPGLTQYNKTHLYQTYDVTDYIEYGENALGAVLAEGWWSGGATFMGHNWNFFGDRQSLLAKLVITYSDGKEETVVTNPATWQYYDKGPVKYGSFFQGEVYDATREESVKGWSTASYTPAGWKTACEIPLEGTVCDDQSNGMPPVNDYSAYTLTGQTGQTVKAIRELTAIGVEEIRPGVFIYDMGQNMVGVPKINLSERKPGEKIKLRYAEVQYPDLPEYNGRTGMVMMENIRAAMAQDIYITKGGYETIQPRFTFHGYRYVEITGIDKPIPVGDVKGTVLSSIHEITSHYETSNSKVNKLWENIIWSAYGNFLSIPTDCPQRNERLGWSGDISVFSHTATYLAYLPQFLRRHMQAMRDTQREDGRFADIAPLGGGFGGMLWGSAGITVTWESYRQYGDKKLLAGQYDAMNNYINYLLQQIDPETNVMGEKYRSNWGSLGDWLSPEYDRNEKSLLWEAYFIYDLQLMSRIAAILHKEEDVNRFNQLCSDRKEFFNKTYLDETGKTVFRDRIIDTQVSYVLPLAFNIVDDRLKEAVRENFTATLTRENRADNGTQCPPYSLMTGFIGTAWINKALSDVGYNDIAYRLLQQTSYPSWLYPVEQGATTIWERLNSYTHMDGFGGNNRMNSFNHYSFGAIGSWLCGYSLGIERDDTHPGFKQFILAPVVDSTGEMTYANGFYDSPYGRIKSSWNARQNGYSYEFEIPANTSATICLPDVELRQISSNGKNVKAIKGLAYTGKKGDKQTFHAIPGVYRLQIDR